MEGGRRFGAVLLLVAGAFRGGRHEKLVIGPGCRDGQQATEGNPGGRVLSCGEMHGLERNANISALKGPWDLGRRNLGK